MQAIQRTPVDDFIDAFSGSTWLTTDLMHKLIPETSNKNSLVTGAVVVARNHGVQVTEGDRCSTLTGFFNQR